MVGVAKRPKAPDCGSGIRGFESHLPPHKKYPPAMQGGIFLWHGGNGFEEGGTSKGGAKKCPVDIFLARGRIPSPTP